MKEWQLGRYRMGQKERTSVNEMGFGLGRDAGQRNMGGIW